MALSVVPAMAQQVASRQPVAEDSASALDQRRQSAEVAAVPERPSPPRPPMYVLLGVGF
jgi:hypothetical protein